MAQTYGDMEIEIDKTTYLINEEVKGRMEFKSDILEG